MVLQIFSQNQQKPMMIDFLTIFFHLPDQYLVQV